jgi:hypothetical protein
MPAWVIITEDRRSVSGRLEVLRDEGVPFCNHNRLPFETIRLDCSRSPRSEYRDPSR